MKLLNKYEALCFLILITTALTLLSGCSSTQSSDFYQLNEKVDPSLTGIEKGHVIGVGPIQLPEYINRPQIVTRNSNHQMNISEFHRWIEPLNDSISRVMVINLSNNLSSNRVYWVPRQDRQIPLNLRVVVDIGRFDGQLDETVFFESRWSILDNKNQPVLTRVTLIKVPVNGKTYEDLVVSMNKALQNLGIEISQSIKSILTK